MKRLPGSEGKSQGSGERRTLLTSVLLSAPGPIVIGLGLLVGRSWADSPDIDGLVFFEGGCTPGEMADVLINETDDGYLYGTQIGGAAC